MEQTASEKMIRLVSQAPPSMVEAIDDYWHAHKLRSRGEAVRQLLAYALERMPEPRSDRVVRK